MNYSKGREKLRKWKRKKVLPLSHFLFYSWLEKRGSERKIQWTLLQILFIPFFLPFHSLTSNSLSLSYIIQLQPIRLRIKFLLTFNSLLSLGYQPASFLYLDVLLLSPCPSLERPAAAAGKQVTCCWKMGWRDTFTHRKLDFGIEPKERKRGERERKVVDEWATGEQQSKGWIVQEGAV